MTSSDYPVLKISAQPSPLGDLSTSAVRIDESQFAFMLFLRLGEALRAWQIGRTTLGANETLAIPLGDCGIAMPMQTAREWHDLEREMSGHLACHVCGESEGSWGSVDIEVEVPDSGDGNFIFGSVWFTARLCRSCYIGLGMDGGADDD